MKQTSSALRGCSRRNSGYAPACIPLRFTAATVQVLRRTATMLILGGGLLGCGAAPPATVPEDTNSDAGSLVYDIQQWFDGSNDTGLFQDTSGALPDVIPLGECQTAADCMASKGPLAGPCQTWSCGIESGTCIAVASTEEQDCDDDNACTTASKCVGGLCVQARPDALLDCFDGNPCTNDICDPAAGCTAIPTDGGPCSDGDDCTNGDYCDAGVCMPGTNTCPAQCGNGACELAKGETCVTCPLDCEACSSGCQASASPGCGACACESCVCELFPACCTEAWTEECAAACTSPCGGSCTGCGPAFLPTCHGCECEECVCQKEPTCCTLGWTAACASLCAVDCLGCPDADQ